MTTDHDDALPPYAYIPGGPWPHPSRRLDGLATPRPAPPTSIPADDWRASSLYVHGFRLFDAGYYWEAHEAWEELWHAHRRVGPTADVLRALIKMAAAGVKVREGQSHGVETHARRAADLFEAVRRQVGPTWVGLDLARCAILAGEAAATTPSDPGERGERVVRVFGFDLSPDA